METLERTGAKALAQVALRLGPSLTRGRVLLSELHACLEDVGAPPAAYERCMTELRSAGIEVVDDIELLPDDASQLSLDSVSKCAAQDGRPLMPGTEVSTPSSPSTTTDPVAVARDRLAADRTLPSRAQNKQILTASEEVGLTLLARPGGDPLAQNSFSTLEGEARQAAEAMLLHNIRLVHSIARVFAGQGLDHEDLVSSGIEGLIRAIELFDPFRGFKFSTYASQWIRQSISREVDNTGRVIRLPVHMCERVRKVWGAQQRLMTTQGRNPRWDELAIECDLPVEKIEEALRIAPSVISLDTPLDGVTLGDILDRPTSVNEHIELHGLYPEDLELLFLHLDAREEDILRRRHGMAPHDEKQTLDEIGVNYGVSRERIRQIESKALTKLREAVGFTLPSTSRQKARASTGADDLVSAELI